MPRLTDFLIQLLANMTCNQAAATSLVLGSGLLSWIELQLQTAKSGESLAWVKILENIVTVLDLFRLGTSTAGEWRLALSRCLLRLLDGASKYFLCVLVLVLVQY